VAEITNPTSFADLILSPAYPTWAKPKPADNPTQHRKTYTFLRGIAAAWDRIVDAATVAAYGHGASTCPADGLDALGETYGGLARAIRDTDASYRDYLKDPIDRWYSFGTKRGLIGELAHLGYANAEVVTWRDLVDAGAGLPADVFGNYTTFFFVAIYAPTPIFGAATYWKTSQALWKNSGATWGATPGATQYIDEIRRVIALVKPAHTSCRFIVVFKDSMSGLDAQKLPTGNYVTFPCNEPWERVRPSYAYNSDWTTSPLVK